MILHYIEKALAHARYEIIKVDEPYYGEIPDLAGVYATGKTLEECQANLMEVIDGWIIVRLQHGLPIPPLISHKPQINTNKNEPHPYRLHPQHRTTASIPRVG